MAGNAGGIRAGKAYVEAYLKDDALQRGLDRAARKVQAFGRGVSAVGKSLLGIGAVAGGGLAVVAKTFADMGSELVDMSERTGVSVEALSELGYAAGQSGTDMEALEKALGKMSKFLFEATGGSKEAAATLRILGLTIKDLAGLSPDEQFKLLGERLSQVANATDRGALAMALFGKGGRALLPLLKDGAAGVESLQEEFRALGGTMSTEDAEAAKAFGDQLKKVTAIVKATAFNVGVALVPALADGAKWLIGNAKGFLDWIKANRGAVIAVAAVTAAVVAAGVALVVLGSVITAVGTIFGAISGVLAVLLSPIGLAIAAVLALGVAFLALTDTGGPVLNWLSEKFQILKDDAVTAFGGIADALAAGDLALAGKIIWATLKLEWSRGLAAIRSLWFDAIDAMVAKWQELGQLPRTLLKFLPGGAALGAGLDVATQLKQSGRLDQARAAGEAGDQDEIDRLKAELAGLRQQAKEEKEAGLAPKGGHRPGPVQDMLDHAQDRVDVMGTFNGLAIAGLGATSTTEKMASGIEQIARNTDKLARKADGGGLVFT